MYSRCLGVVGLFTRQDIPSLDQLHISWNSTLSTNECQLELCNGNRIKCNVKVILRAWLAFYSAYVFYFSSQFYRLHYIFVRSKLGLSIKPLFLVLAFSSIKLSNFESFLVIHVLLFSYSLIRLLSIWIVSCTAAWFKHLTLQKFSFFL